MSEDVKNKSCVANCESASRAASVACGRRYESHASSKVAAGRIARVKGVNAIGSSPNTRERTNAKA